MCCVHNYQHHVVKQVWSSNQMHSLHMFIFMISDGDREDTGMLVEVIEIQRPIYHLTLL